MVRVLLEQRDFRLVADLDECLPIHHAVLHRNTQLVHLLLTVQPEAQLSRPNAAGDIPLHISCRNADHEITQAIVAQPGGALPNQQNAAGRTPLHEVVAAGDGHLLKLMHRLHADANIRDKVGMNPRKSLHLSCNFPVLYMSIVLAKDP